MTDESLYLKALREVLELATEPIAPLGDWKVAMARLHRIEGLARLVLPENEAQCEPDPMQLDVPF